MLSGCRKLFKDQAGTISVVAVLGAVALLGIGALAVDIAHLAMVKGELQKAAEAGALAGARVLDQNLQAGQLWNFDLAATTAGQAIQANSVDTVSLSGYTSPDPSSYPMVETGYWDLSWTNGIPNTSPANGHLLGYSNPSAYTPASSNEVPAVKVTLAKLQGGTGVASAVGTVFASVMGSDNNSMDASASAVVAIRPSPTTIAPGDAFPFAIPISYIRQHWHDNPPVTFTVGSAQHDSSGGQWTTFKTTDNSASYVNSLIINGNTTSISVGDQVYIQNGEKSSIYNTVLSQYNSNPNKIYMVAAVDDSFSTGTYTTVRAFGALKIMGCSGSGSDPYVSCQFVPTYIDPRASGGGGEHLGPTLPPKLVQ